MCINDEPIIAEGIERHIYLGMLSPQGPFPSKIYAHSFCIDDKSVLYIPRINAHAVVVMEDGDNVVGRCYCSNCNDSINTFDTYCSHCGARLIGKKIIGEQ